MNKRQKIVALAIIENLDGQILVSQRHDPDIAAAHLKWDLPGGTNEFGESLEETVIREAKEETGLTVEVRQMLPESISQHWEHKEYIQHTLVFAYVCNLINGSLHLNDPKIVELKWLNPKDAIQLDLLPTTEKLLKSYIKFAHNSH